MTDSYPPHRIPISKWRKHNLIARHHRLKKFLPKTSPYSPSALAGYLTHYGQVVIKSELGGGGNQVCRVSKRLRDYEWQDYRQTVRVRHLRDLRTSLPLWVAREQCVVQEYIDLLPMKERPTDIRIIVQRNEWGLFEMTGAFCKTAPPTRFVTNVKQGGTINSLSRYLRACCKDKTTRRQIRSTLVRVAVDVGNYFGAHFQNSVYGIDLGLDHSYRVLIIEVNTKPSLEILAEINGRMHQRALALRLWNRTAIRPLTANTANTANIGDTQDTQDTQDDLPCVIPTVEEVQESPDVISWYVEQCLPLHTFSDNGNPSDDGRDTVMEDEQKLGIDPDNTHRANELPSALRVDKTKEVNFEAIRSQQAENFVLNPGRQKR